LVFIQRKLRNVGLRNATNAAGDATIDFIVGVFSIALAIRCVCCVPYL